jgi:hypothetical protein
MPVVANITAADPSTAPSAVTNMVDGDVVNANALVLQAVNPGPTNNPNLTLSFIWSYVLAACTSVVLAAFTGTSFSIAAGPLLTFLQLLANQAANLTKGNTFLGSGNTNTFQGSVTVNTNLFVGGTGTFNGAVGFGGSAPVTVDDTLTVDGLLTAAGGLSVAGVLESAGLTSAGPITGENGVVAADNFVVLNATGNLVSPITIDLSAAAVGVGGLSTGSWVLIFGGTGNTALNGTFQVTALDSTHVSLNGTMGNGTYNASSATIVIGPAVTVPTGYIQFTGTQPAPNQDPGGNNVAWRRAS